jgi:hypothetical protein
MDLHERKRFPFPVNSILYSICGLRVAFGRFQSFSLGVSGYPIQHTNLPLHHLDSNIARQSSNTLMQGLQSPSDPQGTTGSVVRQEDGNYRRDACLRAPRTHFPPSSQSVERPCSGAVLPEECLPIWPECLQPKESSPRRPRSSISTKLIDVPI